MESGFYICLHNTMANIVRKYSFLFQNIDVFNVQMLSSFLSQFHLSDKSGRVMSQIGLYVFLTIFPAGINSKSSAYISGLGLR